MECINCGSPLNKGTKYCSVECQQKYQYKQYIERWKNGKEDGMSGKYQLAHFIRRYIFEKYNNKCCQCGWCEVNQFTEKVPLEIDHIDGDYKNNQEENLRLLCPNCHSLTETYKGANKGKGRKGRDQYYLSPKKERPKCEKCGETITYGSTLCEKCYSLEKRIVKDRPSREELKNLIRKETFCRIGDMYNITDNAIRKWCKGYNLPFRKKDIEAYSDEEWEQI